MKPTTMLVQETTHHNIAQLPSHDKEAKLYQLTYNQLQKNYSPK
jgi:hypothetical protein